MVLIRLDAPAPDVVDDVRRVEVGLAGLVVLRDVCRRLAVPPPPPDLLRDDAHAGHSLVDLEPELGAARVALRDRAVLVPGGPEGDDALAPSIALDLEAAARAPFRLRVSLAGRGHDLLGWWWTDGTVAGSVVRDGARARLAAMPSRHWGRDLADALPDPAHEHPGAAPLEVPADALPALVALEDLPVGGEEAAAAATGVDPATVREVAGWADGVRAVLHASVPPVRADGATRAVIWFLHRTGWWSARLVRDAQDRRTTRLEPATRRDLVGAVAELTTRAWR